MKFAFDIDGVICEETKPYKDCLGFQDVIDKINEIYLQGHKIILFTSRRLSDRKITLAWLRKKKVKYHKLILGKPTFDVYVDEENKLLSVEELLE